MGRAGPSRNAGAGVVARGRRHRAPGRENAQSNRASSRSAARRSRRPSRRRCSQHAFASALFPPRRCGPAPSARPAGARARGELRAARSAPIAAPGRRAARDPPGAPRRRTSAGPSTTGTLHGTCTSTRQRFPGGTSGTRRAESRAPGSRNADTAEAPLRRSAGAICRALRALFKGIPPKGADAGECGPPPVEVGCFSHVRRKYLGGGGVQASARHRRRAPCRRDLRGGP